MDQYGIGTAINAAAHIYFRAARGSGRTTSLVESLKDGDRVIFVEPREAERVKRLCKERGVEITTMVVDPLHPDQVYERGYVGGDGRCVFDHSWVEQYYLNAIKNAHREIDRFQRELSGTGMSHTETTLQADPGLHWRPVEL